MKVTQAIEQLYAKLPFLSEKFSQSVGIVDIVFSGTEATVTTDTAHGLETTDFCTITGLYAPIEIDSLVRDETVITVVTTDPHDLTANFQETVTLSGSNESEFNGEFSIASIVSDSTFQLTTTDSGALEATGSPVLHQETGYLYNQIIGYNQVTSAVDANTFTFALTSSINATISALGSVAVGYRITGAVSFESALAMYTDNSEDEYWAFVVSNSNIASKDRKNNSDGVYTFNQNTGYKQELNQTFTVFVFATASSHTDAYLIKDDMQDIAVDLIGSLCGAKFNNGLCVGNYYANVFDTHLTQFYDKGIYVHSFIFQTTTQISDGDIFTQSTDVAFRNINFEMTPIVASLELRPDTPTLDIDLDLTQGDDVSPAPPEEFREIDAVELGVTSQFAGDVDMAKESLDRIIVSNQDYSVVASDEGAAHIYSRADTDSEWSLEQTILPPFGGANTDFGSAVTMNGDGTRVVVAQNSNTVPAQENVFVYNRSGTTWSLAQTITTTYSNGTRTEQVRLSSDGVTLITRNNSTQGIVEFYRWDGSEFLLTLSLVDFPNTNIFAESTGISENGLFVVMSRRASFEVYEDLVGNGTWTLKGTGSGAASSGSQPRGINISNDGSIVTYNNLAQLSTWLWNGSSYDIVTANLAIDSSNASGLSSDGTALSILTTADAITEVYSGDGSTPYSQIETLTPIDQEQSGSTLVMSYAGDLVLVGNPTWKTSNGNQGRAFTIGL